MKNIKEVFENEVINELYNARIEEIEPFFEKIYGQSETEKKMFKLDDELTAFITEKITDEELKKEILKKLNDLELSMISNSGFWHKHYYKIGVADGISIKKLVESVGVDYDK